MYSLYGDKEEAWTSFINHNTNNIKDTKVSDILESLKNIDVDLVQKNITTINKALTLISSLLTKDEVSDTYTPRPLYKKFED